MFLTEQSDRDGYHVDDVHAVSVAVSRVILPNIPFFFKTDWTECFSP